MVESIFQRHAIDGISKNSRIHNGGNDKKKFSKKKLGLTLNSTIDYWNGKNLIKKQI